MTASPGVSQEAAIAVLAILGAKDHYAAMDAPRDASVAELRRCYLKASVLVHPDKNQHPQATRAFQRVAAAWAVLSEEQKRWAYDQELMEGEQSDDIHMSPDEAFAAFAFAAACAAGGGSAGLGDMAETLFWAQQLGQANAQRLPGFGPGFGGNGLSLGGFGGFGGFGGPPAAPDAVAATFNGICLSVGLYSAGLAVSLLGLPRIGSCARRLAVVQGISQVVIASQAPAVRAACQKATVQVKEAAGDFAEQHPDFSSLASRLQSEGAKVACKAKETGFEAAQTIRELADQTYHMDFREAAGRVKSEGAAAAGKVKQLMDRSCGADFGSCLSWSAPDSDEDDEDGWYAENLRRRKQRDCWKPRAGSWVKLANLQRARHLEGSLGEVLAFNRDSGRYLVQLIPPRQPNGPVFQGGEPETVSKLVLIQNLRPAFERTWKPPGNESNFI
ncbi:unnamed protein product [Effrenium voratum]|uniref:J domain-containing protein n=1 Tax=Effrenium voratum TaxID=2562239 RepID=A0AA36NDJ4_9DINO|nr:unnamed protein product [Effrenium voratum]CAJ1426767.1 unnamed protein product [Effrenium voratum]